MALLRITKGNNSNSIPISICLEDRNVFARFDEIPSMNLKDNQRTNGPVNAHLISWPTKAQNIQNLENIWFRNDLDLQYSHTFINSINCLHLPTFRSQAAIVSEKASVFTFPIEKPNLPNLTFL